MFQSISLRNKQNKRKHPKRVWDEQSAFALCASQNPIGRIIPPVFSESGVERCFHLTLVKFNQMNFMCDVFSMGLQRLTNVLGEHTQMRTLHC